MKEVCGGGGKPTQTHPNPPKPIPINQLPPGLTKATSAKGGAGALTWKAWLAKPSPSCLHTTMASTVPQPSLQTVPQLRVPLRSASTSTLPS